MILPTAIFLEYIESLYSGEPLNREKYTSESEPTEEGEVIDADVARLFKILLMLKRPHKILEIGTSVGYSTVTMAQIAQTYGGQITTIELDPVSVGKAQQNFIQYGVGNCIKIIEGDAKIVVPGLTDTFDYIFMDVGDKSLYKELVDICVEKLNSGGLFIAEDSLFGAFRYKNNYISRYPDFDKYIDSLDEFNSLISKHTKLTSTLLPVGDGVTLAIKKSE